MSKYKINSYRDNVSDYEDKGIPGAFKFGSNLDIRKDVDSLSCTQALVDEGLIDSRSESLSVSPSSTVSPSPSPSPSASSSPTPSPSSSASPSLSVSLSPSVTSSFSPSLSQSLSQEVSSVFRDLIMYFVKASDGYTYGFGDKGYVYRRDADAFWLRVYKDEGGEIKGAAEWYDQNNGGTYLHWATDTVLKRKNLYGRSDWNDVETIASGAVTTGSPLTSADSHFMTEAGGALVIANGPTLAMVGYDASYTNNALNLIPGNIAKTIVERKGRSITGCARASDLTGGVNGAIDVEVPLAQIGDDGELFYADMVSSVPIKRFPGGGKVNPGGVGNKVSEVNFFEWEQTALSWIDKQSVGNMALFAIYDADAGKGGIYTYGRKKKNHPMSLNLEHLLDADELGAVVDISGTTLVSYQDGVDFGVKATDPDNKAQGIYEGLDLYGQIKQHAEVSIWETVMLFCKPLVAGTSLEFWYKTNKNGDFIQAKMQGNVAQFTNTGETRAVFNVQVSGDIFEPRVVLNPTGNISPEVYQIIPSFT